MSAVSRRVLVPLDLPPAAAPHGDVHTLHGTTMGTSWSVRLVADAAQLPVLHHIVQAALDEVVAQMSHWDAQSNLSRFNRAVAGSWHVLPEAFFTVLDCAMALARDSHGAYDPTIGKLVDLWGFGPRQQNAPINEPINAPPSDAAIQSVRATCGWERLTLDHATRRALQPGNLWLDFSSIAKGFGVDHAAQALERAGVRSYVLEVGGELRGLGIKPDGSPWWVELERPPAMLGAISSSPAQEHAMPIDIVALHGMSVATSGDYHRYFDHQGVRYAHTLDPRTGYPVQHTASVAVLHPSCMVADALATLLTVLGTPAALDYAERCNVAARILTTTQDGLVESRSTAFDAMLS